MSSVASSWRRQTGACDPPRNAPTRLPVGRKTPRRPRLPGRTSRRLPQGAPARLPVGPVDGVRGERQVRDKVRRPISRSDSRTAEELLAFCPQRRADPSLGRTAGHCLSTPNDDVARQHVERARLKVHEPRQDRNALLVRRRRARETSELFCDLVEFVRESDPDDRRHEAQAHGKLATRALPEREVDRRPSGTRDLHGRRRVIEFGLHAPIVRR